MVRHRKVLRSVSAVALAVSAAATPTLAQIRAFGSAEGYGAVALGARASATPTVYHVTNLNATGAGSFVDAISAANRIIVFDVAGVIHLSSAPSAKSGLYIAGQTAPGGGIIIDGYQALGFANTSNNIARHLRIRPGSQSPGSDNGIGMGRTGATILDHLSIEFGKYNNIDAVSQTADRPLVTIQNSILADPISNGTSNRGQGFNAHLEAVNGYFTLTKNLWASGHSRNPLAKVNDQFINNIEYNNSTGYLTSGTSTAFDHDVVNNAFIWGPASTSSSDFGTLSTPDQFYQSGNVQDTNKNGVFDPTATAPLSDSDSRRSLTPLHGSTLSLPTLSVNDAYSYVLAKAGASLVRDSLDTLVMGQVQTLGNAPAGYTAGTAGPAVTPVPLDVESPDVGHTGLYHKSSDTGLPNNGVGTITTETRPAGFDADNDGVADAWEATHGMNSSSAADALVKNPLGYLMIEQYINELGDTNDTRTYSATSGALATAASWGGTLPLAVDNAKIAGTGAANGAASVSSGSVSVMKLDIGGNGPAAGEVVTVNGGTLDVYDTITVGANNNATLNISSGTVDTWNIQLGNTVWTAPGSSTNYTGTLNLSGGTLLVSSIVRGVGTPGNWSSGGSMTITGGTIKAAGVLYINVPMAFNGASTINTNGFDGSINGNMTGSAAITKSGAGTLTLVGNNSGYSGPIALTAGAITLNMNSSNSPTGLITMSSGTTLNIAASGTNTPMATASGATVTLNGIGGLTYGGTISGPSNSTILVTGTSTGTSNFSLGASMTGFAGTLDFTNGKNVRINQGGSASAKFVMGDNSALIRVPFGTTLSMGSLSGGATSIIQGATNDAVTTTLSVGALNTSTTYTGIIANGTNAAVGLTGLTKVGTGTLTLNGSASTYTGVTTITGGTLAVTTLANGGAVSSIGQSTNAAANLVLDGGTLQYNGAAVTSDRAFTLGTAGGSINASGTGPLSLSSTGAAVISGTGNRTLTLTGTNTGFNNLYAVIGDPSSGTTSLSKTGTSTWRLFSAQTYSGSTTVTAGTLYLVNSNILPSGAGKGDVTVASGATLDFYGNSQAINGLNGGGTVTTTLNTARTLTVGSGNAGGSFSGVLTQGASQTLALTKTGTGTQVLTGANTYTGTTTIEAGTLVLGANATQPILGGASVTTPAGADIKGGRLAFDYAGGSTPAATIYTELQAGHAGGFASGKLRSSTATSNRGLGYFDDTAASRFYVQPALYGDSNLDGTVNFTDLLALAASYGNSGTWSNGDANYDTTINFSDLLALASNYGSTMIGSFASDWAMAQSLVPEPGTLATTGLSAATLLRRRRR
ncbi:MAG: autotransporter-associated beta strand repeat-containing protein [Tepidisphaeraceae bacterium]